MKKRYVIVIIIAVLAVLFIFVYSNLSTPALTKAYITSLSEKKGTENITWDDFKKFNHEDVGSGNYVYKYSLKEGGYLYLSGPDLNSTPMKITITNKDGSEEVIK